MVRGIMMKSVHTLATASSLPRAIRVPGLARSCHFATSDKNAPIVKTKRKAEHNKVQKRDCSVEIPLFHHVPFEIPNKLRIDNALGAPEASKRKGVTQYIEELNAVSAKNPMTVFYLFFGSRASTWFVFTKAISSLHFFAGPELAIGFLVSRFTSKFRQPFNFAIAAPLAAAFPILTKIKVTGLLGVMTPPPAVQELGQDMQDTFNKHYKSSTDSLRAAGGTQKSIADAADKVGVYANKAGSVLGSAVDQLQGPIDKYGMSFYLSSKVTSISTIVGVAYAVHCGLDVPTAMQSLGLPLAMQEVGQGMSCMAAAVVLNSFLLPAHIFAAMKLAPGVGARATEWETRYYAWVKTMEEKEARWRAGRDP